MIYDYLIIGGGISGAAAAYELAPYGRVVLIEAETTLGYHSTGRSAALFTRNYGVATVRCINAASHAFFTNPPDGFCDHPLLTPRGSITVAAPGTEDFLAPLLKLSVAGAEIQHLDAAQTLALVPFLRPEKVASAAFETNVMDIDVAGMHQSYLRCLKQRNGDVMTNQRVTRLDHDASGWRVATDKTSLKAHTIINAAGAWAGQIGALAAAIDIGLVPKRRTGIIIEAPPGTNVSILPVVEFVNSSAYIKPEAGKLMVSPGDQTPTEPQDVRPEEMDIAILVDWIERETLIPVRHIAHRWAGLRSFVRDEVPVVGFDPTVPDFFWLTGQGGFGIMMAPALARATATLCTKATLPVDLISQGINESALSPLRLQTYTKESNP